MLTGAFLATLFTALNSFFIVFAGSFCDIDIIPVAIAILLELYILQRLVASFDLTRLPSRRAQLRAAAATAGFLFPLALFAVASAWSVGGVAVPSPSPYRDPALCNPGLVAAGLQQRGHVCNEDAVLTRSCVRQLNAAVALVRADSTHACGDGRHGYEIGVAVVASMPGGTGRSGGALDRSAMKTAEATFDAWGVGNKQCNNGVLIFMSRDDRRLYIKTGRGAKGKGRLTDRHVERIVGDMKVPLRRAEHEGGACHCCALTGAVAAIAEVLSPTTVGLQVATTNRGVVRGEANVDEHRNGNNVEQALGGGLDADELREAADDTAAVGGGGGGKRHASPLVATVGLLLAPFRTSAMSAMSAMSTTWWACILLFFCALSAAAFHFVGSLAIHGLTRRRNPADCLAKLDRIARERGGGPGGKAEASGKAERFDAEDWYVGEGEGGWVGGWVGWGGRRTSQAYLYVIRMRCFVWS